MKKIRTTFKIHDGRGGKKDARIGYTSMVFDDISERIAYEETKESRNGTVEASLLFYIKFGKEILENSGVAVTQHGYKHYLDERNGYMESYGYDPGEHTEHPTRKLRTAKYGFEEKIIEGSIEDNANELIWCSQMCLKMLSTGGTAQETVATMMRAANLYWLMYIHLVFEVPAEREPKRNNRVRKAIKEGLEMSALVDRFGLSKKQLRNIRDKGKVEAKTEEIEEPNKIK